ncbi:hypothetical protein SAMN05892883_1499 [Jatrophihabitans sp. GAS493]|uniref:hypothetical protein n=1 Tax=Jatrophihabitans sp. GAS493 TaxID=1907575 RepID=UPI000BB6C8A9|nr:hypothetical protein [Jatrophihabitans sp. GAS493]SOD72060.1 hypothetical protein SAMN05892883_1499 [Jatrophihabitans sp. GAS493]
MQFSLFGAATADPILADFDGVLIGGGHWVRHGDTARLSVVVADRWRADELHHAFHERGVGEGSDPIVRAEEGFAVRSAFTADLRAQADRWTVGANEAPPPGFQLDVGGLRLWAVTAGRADEVGYLLGTDAPDDVIHTISGAQLSRLGLAAVSLTARSGGPGWRVTSAKRLRRLAELLGEAPVGSDRDWPTF